ncbi:hypothetical protein GQX74_005722 [Glossina fuscipes]|nr:hypothetical protein GQX74_005722 [Glossina fuscipes]
MTKLKHRMRNDNNNVLDCNNPLNKKNLLALTLYLIESEYHFTGVWTHQILKLKMLEGRATPSISSNSSNSEMENGGRKSDSINYFKLAISENVQAKNFNNSPDSSKLVDSRGCAFRAGKEEQTMMVVGPMTPFSRDLMPIFKVLVSNNSKLCNLVNHGAQMVMYQIRRNFQNLSGHEVQLLKLPGIEYSYKLWRYWMTRETSEFGKLLGNGTKFFIAILMGSATGGQNIS